MRWRRKGGEVGRLRCENVDASGCWCVWGGGVTLRFMGGTDGRLDSGPALKGEERKTGSVDAMLGLFEYELQCLVIPLTTAHIYNVFESTGW